ncbi:hypothetical protein [Labilibaculum antarcticum]|nr:hypothetical protein [Labilibaculum antarcticum]
MKYLLCKTSIADKTGSHVIPAWMIAIAFDTEGRNRDHEAIYNLNAYDSKLPYCGGFPLIKVLD